MKRTTSRYEIGLGLLLGLLASAGCQAAAPAETVVEAANDDARRVAAEAALDAFHGAASAADEETYFGLLAPGAIFLGTDATERWTKEEFRSYAHPHFAAGRGWTYTKTERHLYFSADGRTAWFDERLWNAKYGDCRGTGVLVLEGSADWRIAHYNLTFPIPNDLALQVVGLIQGQADE